MSSLEEHIEIYSGNRNRLLYPKVSSFEIPFAPTTQLKKDAENPVINGCVYYKFSIEPAEFSSYRDSVFQSLLNSYSNNLTFYLSPQTSPYYPFLNNFFSGYTAKIGGSTDTRIVTSYNPTSGKITLDQPWNNEFVDPVFGILDLSLSLPTYDYISIPSQDINGNISPDIEGYYNGYYVIFESDYKDYSNQYNSNIFYRKITYYDNVTRRAYFDKPIPFDYKDQNGFYPQYITPQYITLRKSLPLERWNIDTYTYINTTPPSNPLIGPLIGPVITLPEGASNIDNYYKGKYVYFYSNTPYYQLNYQDIRKEVIINPISNYFFYPIYGFYYINAYNAATRELSVSLDINNTSCSETINVSLPAYDRATSIYNASSFQDYFKPYSNVDSISEVTPGLYRAYVTPNPGPYYQFELDIGGLPAFNIPGPPGTWKIGGIYTIKWRMRRTPGINYFRIIGMYGIKYQDFTYFYDYYGTLISQSPDYYNFNLTTVISSQNLGFIFELSYTDPSIIPYLEWDFFEIKEETIINITEFSNNSYSPLDYTGTMVSMNDTVCYDVSLSSLTLPNVPLKTGSKISFYPYVYVELSNTTAPNHASDDIIYSNNPYSNKALFIAPVGLRVNPNTGTFLKLSSRMTQTIKFKPNDNLKFSVYLPDGSLFEPITDDLYPPYEPDNNIQIEAVFNLVRKVNSSNQMII